MTSWILSLIHVLLLFRYYYHPSKWDLWLAKTKKIDTFNLIIKEEKAKYIFIIILFELFKGFNFPFIVITWKDVFIFISCRYHLNIVFLYDFIHSRQKSISKKLCVKNTFANNTSFFVCLQFTAIFNPSFCCISYNICVTKVNSFL